MTSMDLDFEEDCDDGVSVARMYSLYEEINKAKDKSLVEDEYKELLSCVRKTDKEKRLAGPFIARFIECFPDLTDNSLDALVTLCECENDSVRKQVIKDFVTVGGKVAHKIPVIADMYAQLMSTIDNGELGIIHNSLVRLFGKDAEGTMKGLFWGMYKSKEDNIIVERGLDFLASKMKQMDTITIYVEKTLLSSVKPLVPSLTDVGFLKMMEIISLTKIFDTRGGRQTVIELVMELVKPDDDFDGTLEDNIDKLIMCGEQIVKIVSTGETCPGPFILYCCTKVIPNLRDCLGHEDGEMKQFEMLKLMAEAALYLQKSFDKESAEKCLNAIYQDILKLLPPPSQEKTVYNYKYSIIECYIFLLYKLCSRNPEFLDGDKAKLLELRTRLQVFARVVMGYVKKMKSDLAGKDKESLKSGELKEKAQGLKLANNIYVIVKDFFRTPILCGLKVGPSWVPISILEGKKRKFETQDKESERKLKFHKSVESPQQRSVSAQRVDHRPRRVISPPRYHSPQGYNRNRRGHSHSRGVYRYRTTYSRNRRY